MTDPVTLSSLMINGSIPLTVTVTQSTNWTQYGLTALIAIVSSFGIFLLLYMPSLISALKAGGLSHISRITKKNVVMIKHTSQGLFSQAMIDQQCLIDLSSIMNKMKGEDFDLILHTPGGDVFSSLAISRLIKQYPGTIRACVPLFSMSGGSLLALSCDELLMTQNACLGPIDPQLGSLFRYGSAAAWEKIVKFKGKKAEDQSISFAMMGKQYTKSISEHLNKIIDFDLSSAQKGKLIKFLTDGSIEHAYPLTISDLQGFGIDVYTLQNKKFLKLLSKFISCTGKEGVTYHRIPKWQRNRGLK